MVNFFLLSVILVGVPFIKCVTPPPGQTLGQPWPMPQTYQPTSSIQMLSPDSFTFQVTGKTCDLLEDAITRYFRIIFDPDGSGHTLKFQNRFSKMYGAMLPSLEVSLANDCEQYPSMGMDESCRYIL